MKTLTAALASASMLALVAPGLASAQDYQSFMIHRKFH